MPPFFQGGHYRQYNWKPGWENSSFNSSRVNGSESLWSKAISSSTSFRVSSIVRSLAMVISSLTISVHILLLTGLDGVKSVAIIADSAARTSAAEVRNTGAAEAELALIREAEQPNPYKPAQLLPALPEPHNNPEHPGCSAFRDYWRQSPCCPRRA